MKNYGIIAEYNPMHYGHLYQIRKIREMDSDAIIITIISTFFVQRGEASFLDPKYKTKAALSNGADLVLALPTLFSLQSAENFAYGALSILNQTKNIDHLVFGAESDYNKLWDFAKFQLEKAPLIEEKRIEFMDGGCNYNQGLIKACRMVGEKIGLEISDDLFQSNNILALEYLKSLIRLNSSISPLCIRRSGHRYNETKITEGQYPSATAIRKYFKEDPSAVKNILPEESYQGLLKSSFIDDSSLFNLISYKLVIERTSLTHITGYEEGLERHLRKNVLLSENYVEFIENSATKRYRKTRIQRFLINMLLENTAEFVDKSIGQKPEWVRVLGFNKKGQDFLRHSKEKSDLIYLTQFKQYSALMPFAKKQFDKEADSCNLYYFSNKHYDDYFRWIPVVIKD
ncbi:MAG: nucleotidyltransferase family protein [Gallicola sp.]|nr:nucleotidyltransferase family protein [Gallicola sp.]